MRFPRIVPDPGVYEHIPDARYHLQWDCASNSRLTLLRRSPAHLKAQLDEPRVDTEALTLGRAAHRCVLEPDLFAKQYVCAPDVDRRTKIGKDTWADLELRFGPGAVLKRDRFDACERMRDAIRAHPAARALLAGVQHVELSLVWDDRGSQVRCKARLDGYAPEIHGGTIVDIKTTRDASLRAFEKAIFGYGYHRQGAMYLEGAFAHNLPAVNFVIIAVESEAPYAVAVYRLTEGAIDAGAEQLAPLLKTYAMCTTLGEWPAYSHEVQPIALPPWAWNQIDEETADAMQAEDAAA